MPASSRASRAQQTQHQSTSARTVIHSCLSQPCQPPLTRTFRPSQHHQRQALSRSGPHISVQAACTVLLLAALLLPASASAKPFRYESYSSMHARLAALASANPTLVRLESAQARFGLPSVGNCSTTVSATGAEPCQTWIVTLTEHDSLADDPGRAEVLVSGEVHGDEVVGPHAVLAYVEAVVRAVKRGDPYFARMVRERVVVLLPMANAVGFHRNERGERQEEGMQPIDPNRDFAFDQDVGKCMQTVAARVINEIMREGLFRLLVTFHGGTNVIGYEWGDMTHCQGRSCAPAPDDRFMHEVGNRMAEFAGTAGKFESKYPVGTMGALVYPVNGGMEDWAYGASWSGQAVKCAPKTLGGYPEAKTSYTDATHRCVTYLVETSLSKRPAEHTLGDDTDVLTRRAEGDGHVPRNVRLLVAAVDSVAPYIMLNVSSAAANGTSEGQGQSGRGKSEKEALMASWHVGGAFTVDGTHLQWTDASGSVYGTSDAEAGAAGAMVSGESPTRFAASIPQMPSPGKPLYVRAAAIVDGKLVPDGASESGSTQAHIVGVRSDPKWSYTNGKKVVMGKRVFHSRILRVAVAVSAAAFGSGGGKVSVTPARAGFAWPRRSAEGDELHALASLAEGTTVSDGGQSGKGRAGGGDGMGIDPRDRNAVVSGVAGVLLLVGVTMAIMVAIGRHHRRMREAKEADFEMAGNGESVAEQKEPLHKGGEVEGEGESELGFSVGSDDVEKSAGLREGVVPAGGDGR